MSATCDIAFAGGPDGDGDGIPDSCDICLFDGPTPPSLPNSASAAGLQITNGVINGSGNIDANVPPGGTITATYDWAVTSGPSCASTGCPDCITQYYVSIEDSNVGTDCFYSDVACYSYENGSEDDTLTAPTAPGTYYVGFSWSWEYYCHPQNYGGHFSGARTAFGAICVKSQ
jgi:hypothetical protein